MIAFPSLEYEKVSCFNLEVRIISISSRNTLTFIKKKGFCSIYVVEPDRRDFNLYDKNCFKLEVLKE